MINFFASNYLDSNPCHWDELAHDSKRFNQEKIKYKINVKGENHGSC